MRYGVTTVAEENKSEVFELTPDNTKPIEWPRLMTEAERARKLRNEGRRRWREYTREHRAMVVAIFSCEGGGTTVYRFQTTDGTWRFFESGTFMGVEGEIDDAEWTSEAGDSLSEVLNACSFRDWWWGMNVSDLEPQFRGELIEWARNAPRPQASPFFDHAPPPPPSPEFWVDGGPFAKLFRKQESS